MILIDNIDQFILASMNDEWRQAQPDANENNDPFGLRAVRSLDSLYIAL